MNRDAFAAVFLRLPPLLLTVVAVVVLASASWNHASVDVSKIEAFSVGPIDPGSAAEQEFPSAAAFLDGIRVGIRAAPEQVDTFGVVMRLWKKDRPETLLREGRIDVEPTPSLNRSILFVDWGFPRLDVEPGGEYVVQVSLDPSTEYPIRLVATLGDQIDGVFTTNGIPASREVDLAFAVLRAAHGTGIIRSLLTASAGVGLVAVALPLAGIGLILTLGRRGSRMVVPLVRWRSFGELLLALMYGVSIVSSGIVLALAGFAEGGYPEEELMFWAAYGLASVLPFLAGDVGLFLRGFTDATNSLLRPVGVARRVWPRPKLFPHSRFREMWGDATGAFRHRRGAIFVLRMAIVCVVVLALQVATSERAHFGSIPEKSTLDGVRGTALDIVYLSDSSINPVIGNTDQRSTPMMLADLLESRSVLSLNRNGTHMTLYSELIDYVFRNGWRPKVVVIPVQLRSFSPLWLAEGQFENSLTVFRLGGGPLESFTKPVLTLTDYRVSEDFGSYEGARIGALDRANVMQLDNPRLVSARRVVENLREKGVLGIFYFTPLNITESNSTLDPALRSMVLQNLAIIRDELVSARAVVVDLSVLVEPEMFPAKDRYDIGHVNQAGRMLIASELVREIEAEEARISAAAPTITGAER